MNEYYKSFFIGLFVIVACIATVITLLFLRPTAGDEGQILTVRFSNISGINVGTRVTFAGKPVGQVTSIQEIADARQQQINDNATIFYYQITLGIDSKVAVYESDVIEMHTSGLFGERSISIVPVRPANGTANKLVKGQILYGKSEDPFDEALDQLIAVGEKTGQLVDQLNELIEKNSPNITDSIESFKNLLNDADQMRLVQSIKEASQNVSRLAKNAAEIALSLNENGFGDNLSALTESLASVVQAIDDPDKLRETFDNISITCKNMKEAAPDLNQTLKNLNTLTTSLVDGQGTLGKLVIEDDIYEKIDDILARIDLLMSDINNYGVLFHLNKGWKRQKAAPYPEGSSESCSTR